MKRTHNMKRLILPIAAMILMAACQKEMPDGRMVTLQVRMEGEAKTCIQDHTPWWHNGDQFYINNGESGSAVRSDGGNCEIEDILEADHYTAIFPKSIVSGTPDLTSSRDLAVKMPRTYQYGEEEGETGIQKFNIPMVGLSDTSATTMQFKNVGGLIKVVVTDLPAGEVLDSIVVQHNKASLSGDGTISNIRSASPVLSCTGSKEVSLVFADGTAYGNGTYYLPVPVIASNSSYAFTINMCVHNATTLIPKCYGRSQSLGGGYISRNSMATVPFAVSQDLVKPFDNYYFMMGPNKKVLRSPGVLYHGQTQDYNCYYFCEDQTEARCRIYGITEIDPPESFYGNIYLPWSPPVGNVYGPEQTAYYWLRRLMEIMEHPTNTRVDFASLVPGATEYFTPTGAEWKYLLTHSRIGGASIGNTKGGLVVLPNNFDGADCDFKAGFSTDSAGFRNNYTTTQWEYMEAHGAMILPMFGVAVIGKNQYDYYEFTPLATTMGAYWLENTADSCLYISYSGAEIKSMEEVSEIVTHDPDIDQFIDFKNLCTVRLMKDLD